MNTNEFVKFKDRLVIYQLLYISLIIGLIGIIFLYFQTFRNKIYIKNVQERSYDERIKTH